MSDCKHSWVYQNQILASNPPGVRRICAICGKKETLFGTLDTSASYEDVEKQFTHIHFPRSEPGASAEAEK